MVTRASVLGWLRLALVCLVFWSQAPAAAAAEARLDLSRLAGGAALVAQTAVLEDPTAKLSLHEVMAMQSSFVKAEQDASFGFTRSAIWIRFAAHNPEDHVQSWLLELAFSHLDQIDLYVLDERGQVRHTRAGDTLPFAARPVQVPTFVFPQETGPHAVATYYLRVSGNGAMRVPLRAWLTLDFVHRESSQNLILWLFYGIVAAMTFYNIGTAGLLRRREYFLFVGLLVSLGGSILTLSGQTFQYLLPGSPDLANRALGVFMGCALVFVQLHAREVLRDQGVPRVLAVDRVFAWTLPPSTAALVVALFAPQTFSQLVVFAAILVYIPIGAYQLWRTRAYVSAAMRFYYLSFYCLVVTIPLALLAHAKVLPPIPLFVWAAHIGCASFSILTSLALPSRINDMTRSLASLNTQLSERVVDLKLALSRAEVATKAKDEFMATMSHELRTPLNAIINVPQGLLEDFVVERTAKCEACGEDFELDEHEQIESNTPCPVCARPETLRPRTETVFTGDAARTARFLLKIERAGHHLLQMVNSVLDFSKMEAGHFELEQSPMDLGALLRDVVEQLSELAVSRAITIELVLCEASVSAEGDALRIRQVLLNLLTNAIKFSSPNGRIVVDWQRDAVADTIAVSDEGIGIAPEDHERIFESFEQVHKGDTRKYGGTGLGLSISRSLVRMHGGELWVESELGAGSTFKFSLPRGTAKVAKGEAPV